MDEAEAFGHHVTLRIMKTHELLDIDEVLPLQDGEQDMSVIYSYYYNTLLSLFSVTLKKKNSHT